MITKTELMLDNVRAFGHADAARIARRQGVPFTHFYWMVFGHIPRTLKAPPLDSTERVREILRKDARTHIGRIASR